MATVPLDKFTVRLVDATAANGAGSKLSGHDEKSQAEARADVANAFAEKAGLAARYIVTEG